MTTTSGFFELLDGSSSPFLAAGDVVAFVDISDPSQALQGSLVKGTLTQFFAQLPVPVAIKSASATAFTVGLNGATNPAFSVNAATALQVAGLKVTGAVTGGTVAVVVTDSGADSSLTVNAKGTGTIGIGSVSTGRVTITPVVTLTGLVTTTAGFTGAVPFAGLATFNAGATVASGQTLTVTGVTITGLTADSVATGTFPGVYTITGALTLTSTGLVYDGKTLTGSTGTGNMVLSAGPTLTGTITAAIANFSGAVTLATSAQFKVLKNGSGSFGSGPIVGLSNAADTDGIYLQLNASNGLDFWGWQSSAATVRLTLAPTGAVTFAGAVSGITTLASGNITSTAAGSLTIFTSSTGTNSVIQEYVNTGGTYLLGVDSSTNGNFGALSAYAFCIATPAGLWLQVNKTTNAAVINGATSFNSNAVSGITTLALATTIGVGAATPSASGSGVTFPATQSASTSVNTLDDYEEGDWTPSLGGNTTYSSQVGRYVKIGKQVTVWCLMTVTTLGTGSVNTISGLPFTCATGGNSCNGQGAVIFASLAVSPAFLQAYVISNTTTMGFSGTTAAGPTCTTLNVFGNSAQVQVTVTYETTT